VKGVSDDKNLVPPRFRPPQWQSMSVLIGIICPEAIVLAADSQITEVPTGTFSYVDKISIVDFWPGDEVLVAQAGLWPLTTRIVEKMREKAEGVRITKAGDVTKIVEDSIREAKSPLDEEQTKNVDENPPALMLAFYIGQKPYLYTVKVYGHGISTFSVNHYAVEGIGGFLADYLLKEYALPKSHSDLAIATSIFAIKKVKEYQKAYCGGDTIIKRIEPISQFIDLDKQYIGKCHSVPQVFVNLAEKRLVDFDENTKKSRNKRVYAILKKTGRELWVKHLKKVKAEEQTEKEQENKWRAAAPGFTVFHQCSKCEHGFNIGDSHLSKDRKEVRCPKCGKLDPVDL
jgi:predicted Zn finger-like uncharacterized protein